MKDADGIESSVECHIGKLTGEVGSLKEAQYRTEKKVDKVISMLTNGGWALVAITVAAVASAYSAGAFTGAG